MAKNRLLKKDGALTMPVTISLNIHASGNFVCLVDYEKYFELQEISFSWRKEEFPNRNFPEGRSVGFIGQDVEKVLPELVSTNQESYKSVDYAKISAYLVEAIKELKAENDQLKQKMERLERLLEDK